MKYTFTDTPIDPSLTQETGLSEPVLKILAKRGFRSPEEIRKLFHHDFSDVINNTGLLDMDKGASLIVEAIKANERITVYSDYDCDGCCAGTLALETLRKLTNKVDFYANKRSVDGYGLCVNGIKNILKEWPDTKLIITVDNGVASIEGIAYAKEQGLKVLVTDHHEPKDELPNADAIINPKRVGETYPMREICGTTVIFKVMLVVYQKMKKALYPVLDTIDLVAVATVADVMPLIGENRTIVTEGLNAISEGRRPFFRAFLQKKGGEVNSRTIGFQIAPMINAVSRLDHSINVVYGALMSNTEAVADEYLTTLTALNEERRELTLLHAEKSIELAKQELKANPNASVLVIYAPDVPAGIVGIISGRITQEFMLPSIVLCDDTKEGVIKGSARGIGKVNLKDSLDAVKAGLLLGYGGHALAAGLSLKKENLENFKRELMSIMDKARAIHGAVEGLEIDIVLDESQCTVDCVADFNLLEPYGEQFGPPLIGVKAEVLSHQTMGTEKQHLKYLCSSGLNILEWNYTTIPEKYPSKFVGELSLNSFRGNTAVQLLL